jgi:hypothetical protein
MKLGCIPAKRTRRQSYLSVRLAMNDLEGPQRNCADLYIASKKMIHGIDSAHGINIFHATMKCCVLRFSIPLLRTNSVFQ